jgi:hypothetical protein
METPKTKPRALKVVAFGVRVVGIYKEVVAKNQKAKAKPGLSPSYMLHAR